MVRAAHGLLPNPAPAVVELLAGVGAPTRGIDLGVELTTPTGAALLAALASGFGPMPPMTIDCSGFGAGTRDIDGQPNATQVVIGEPSDAVLGGQPVVVLEVNVDDATGETLAHTIARAARRRRPRRVGHADRDEEGPARPHRVGPRRHRAQRPGRRGARARDRIARRARAPPSTAGRPPARPTRSTSPASRCG